LEASEVAEGGVQSFVAGGLMAEEEGGTLRGEGVGEGAGSGVGVVIGTGVEEGRVSGAGGVHGDAIVAMEGRPPVGLVVGLGVWEVERMAFAEVVDEGTAFIEREEALEAGLEEFEAEGEEGGTADEEGFLESLGLELGGEGGEEGGHVGFVVGGGKRCCVGLGSFRMLWCGVTGLGSFRCLGRGSGWVSLFGVVECESGEEDIVGGVGAEKAGVI